MVFTYLQYDVRHSSILELGPSKFLALDVVVNQVQFTIYLLRHTTVSSFYIICVTMTPLTCIYILQKEASCFPVLSPTSSTVVLRERGHWVCLGWAAPVTAKEQVSQDASQSSLASTVGPLVKSTFPSSRSTAYFFPFQSFLANSSVNFVNALNWVKFKISWK